MYIGFVVAMFVAWQLDRFTVVFEENSEPLGVVLAATLIFAVGFFDDLRPISAPAKVAGIAVAGLVLAAMGVTMVYFRIPFYGVVDIGFDWVPLVTILWLLGMTNAINLIDGLDGLAAGIVAIAAGTFFLYSQRLSELDRLEASSIGPLLAVLTLGVCVGFLPHNFNPARIFMGDGGALLLGLLMAASTSVVGGRADPAQGFSGQTYFFLAPLAIPLVILGVPVLDTLFAIVRRSRRRSGLATADKDHLHHRLMRLGHGQRRSVLILWLWTALLSGLVLYPTYTGEGDAFVPLGVAALALLLFTVLHPDVRGRTDDAAADAGS
jgi:UDP-GlcNAc:undecaprenyl-phosphate GlcNAc-1-phosphate transferase